MPKLKSIPSHGPERATAIQEAYARNPRRMTVELARELNVPEAEVIRALPGKMAVELDASKWEELIRGLEPFGSVHVIVTNTGVTIEAFGSFGNFSTFGSYFNVQTKTIDMHIRHDQIGAIFAIEKPGHMDGVNTLSFQFYDCEGRAAFKVFLSFGGKAAPPERYEMFAELRRQFAMP